MATSIKTQAPASKPEVAAQETAAAPQQVNLELARVNRYVFQGTLYEKGAVYAFEAGNARKMLTLYDPTGLPVFIPAKPRTKLVQIPVETRTVQIRQVEREDVDWSGKPVSPIGKLDLGDDDPELKAKLEQLDGHADLVDTGAGAIQV